MSQNKPPSSLKALKLKAVEHAMEIQMAHGGFTCPQLRNSLTSLGVCPFSLIVDFYWESLYDVSRPSTTYQCKHFHAFNEWPTPEELQEGRLMCLAFFHTLLEADDWTSI